MKYDVVVIGSGFGGLACAHLLSMAGRSVLVLESHWQPGGCLQSYQRKGHTFDTGLHYVGGLREGETRLPLMARLFVWLKVLTTLLKCWLLNSLISAKLLKVMLICCRGLILTRLSMHGSG